MTKRQESRFAQLAAAGEMQGCIECIAPLRKHLVGATHASPFPASQKGEACLAPTNNDMNTLYGIKNCDTMKKARTWLDEHGVSYEFHDYKVSGIEREHLEKWCKQFGWEVVLNRAGTTFKKLADADKANLTEAKAIKLMLAQPSMIKRPVLEHGRQLLIGFKPDDCAARVKKSP